MLVVAHFPKLLPVLYFEQIGGATFELLHEPQQIAVAINAMNEEMNMVWHCTVSVQEVSALCGYVMQNRQDLLSSRSVCQIGMAAITADSDEIDFLAQIVGRREARGFAAERHKIHIVICY